MSDVNGPTPMQYMIMKDTISENISTLVIHILI